MRTSRSWSASHALQVHHRNQVLAAGEADEVGNWVPEGEPEDFALRAQGDAEPIDPYAHRLSGPEHGQVSSRSRAEYATVFPAQPHSKPPVRGNRERTGTVLGCAGLAPIHVAPCRECDTTLRQRAKLARPNGPARIAANQLRRIAPLPGRITRQ